MTAIKANNITDMAIMGYVGKCTNCGKEQPEDYNPVREGFWWHLTNYFKLNGFFCPDCYRLVSHRSRYDENGKVVWYPENPEAYNTIAVKHIIKGGDSVLRNPKGNHSG